MLQGIDCIAIGMTNMTSIDAKRMPLDYGEIEQFVQICSNSTWDGDLVSKDDRDALKRKGLIAQRNGLNVPTCAGEYLYQEIKKLFVKD